MPVKTFPVQVRADNILRAKGSPRIPECVHMKAYEVYCRKWSPQPVLTRDEARGGFGLMELIGFLYAASFPEEEQPKRVDEAWNHMKGWG